MSKPSKTSNPVNSGIAMNPFDGTPIRELESVSDEEIDRELRKRGMTDESVRASVQSISSRLRDEFLVPKSVPVTTAAPPTDINPNAVKVAMSTSEDPGDMAISIGSVRVFEEKVAAGVPEWHPDYSSGRYLELSDVIGIGHSDKVFAVKVTGVSMIDSHITSNDTVLVDPSLEAVDGDIVLVFIPGDGHLIKTLRVYQDHLALESSNVAYKPIIITEGSAIVIQGVVVGRLGPLRK
jgi:phage repressor protein C with HTH and peptisase S24 domain